MPMLEPTPDPNPKRPLKSSPKLAALVVLVMILVATPAVQVWRHYGFQIQSVMQARDATEPLAIAVSTQRAVVAHQGLAHRVLLGERGEEALRRQHQTVADNGFSNLAQALALRQFDAALIEAQSAATDWMSLLDALSSRQLQAASSDTAHHLVVEQLVQVIDLVSDTASLHGAAGRPLDEYSQAQRASAAWLAALHPAGPPTALPQALAQRTRRAAAAWQAVHATAHAQRNPELAQAAQAVHQGLRSLQHLPAAQAQALAAPVVAALAAADAPLTQQWRQDLLTKSESLKHAMALWLAMIALQAAALVGVLRGLYRREVREPHQTPNPAALSFAAQSVAPLPVWNPPTGAQSPATAPGNATDAMKAAASRAAPAGSE